MKHSALGIGIGGFAFGVLVGWLGIPRSTDSPTPNSSAPSRSAHLSENASFGSPDSSPAGKGGGSGATGNTSEKSGPARLPSIDDLLALTVANSHTKSYQNLSARLDRLNAGQFQSLIEQFRSLRKDPRAQQALAVIIEKFGETAPREALALAQNPDNQRLPIWHAMGTAATVLVAESPDDAFESFLGFTGHMRQNAINALFNAAAAINPELIPGWFEHPEMQKALRNQHSSWIVRNAVSQWAKTDPAAAAAFVATTQSSSHKRNFVTGIADAWAGQDPTAAIAWAAGLQPTTLKRHARASIATALAREDPRAAIALLDDATSNAERRQLLSSISSGWPQQDLDGLRAWFLELDDPEDVAAAMGGRSHQVGQNPEVFLELLEHVPDSKRNSLSANIVSQWAHFDPDAAIAWVRNLEEGEQKTANMQSLINQLAYSNAAVAAELFDQLDEIPSSMRHHADNIASYWAQHDPAKALEWAEGIEDKNARSNALRSVLNNWVSHEPEKAAAYVLSTEDDKDRRNQISAMVRQWMHYDEAAASAWVHTLEPQDRLSAANAYIQGLVGIDSVERAAAEFVTLVEEFPEALAKGKMNSATDSLVASIARDDPARAVGIYELLPEGNVQESAVNAIAKSWLNKDSIAASEWIGTLPEGKLRDAGAIQVIGKIIETDGESAFAWAASLSRDHRNRSHYLQRAVTSVAQSDPDAATALIANSGLSDEEQARLLEKIE